MFFPASLAEATDLLARYAGQTQVCARGTDLFSMRRKGKSQCEFLLDLSGLGLEYVRRNEDGLAIGAMASLTQLENGLRLPRCLREAAGSVGSTQIRNVATALGNLCTGLPSANVAVALLALKTGRSVKLTLRREEDMCTSTIRHAYRITHRTGVLRDGTIVADRVTLLSDTGAYYAIGIGSF